MDSLNALLVATDFSDGARSALETGARLAKAHDAELHVLHVFSKVDADAIKSMFPDVAGSVEEHLKAKVSERLAGELDAVGLSASDVTLHARAGRMVDELKAVVGEIGAGLLVIGATGEGKRRWGTHAGRCVRQGPQRVLLVPPGQSGPFKRIVACVDYSDVTNEVVDHAAGLARTDGADVSAIHCYELPWERASFGGGIPENAVTADQDYREMLERQYHSEVTLGGGEQLPRFEPVRDVDAARGIINYATDQNADLVVTGTTGRSKLGYWIIGTTAEKVMRDTPSAVLAIKSPKDSPENT